ncbi:3-hydroxyacyl-CoA dehydrogenase [Aestuariivirga sp.]|uniref:3-hydroxyacyl-CoA dehydrogenase n=1 Tax=Aestuariivirga sp. TaxID=2650926 RepID=UPI0035AEB5B0
MKAAILGAGLIGRSWAMVFARGGHDVVLWDQDPAQVDKALAHIVRTLPEMAEAGLIDNADQVMARISGATNLAEAVKGVGFIQENIVERAEPKQALFAEVERLAPSDAIISSSTSAIMPSIIFGSLAARQRCLVSHPLNPPHLAPIVELCGGDFTSPEAIERTRDFMVSCGMSAIVVKREIEGFILNRLQLAVLNEAFRLIAEDYVMAEDLDKTIKDGLALRWSFMGPIETIDLNAPNGIADYLERYGPTIRRVGDSQAAAKPWPDGIGAKLDAERRAVVPKEKLGEATAWRDWRMMALAAHKRSQEKKTPR